MPTVVLSNRSILGHNPRNIVALINRPRPVIIKQLGGSGIELFLPFGPPGVRYDEIGLNYTTISRPGRKPLLEAINPKLESVTFSALIADKASRGKDSVEEMLEKLGTIAKEDVDCSVIYGVQAFPWRARLTQYTYSTRVRDLDGNITQAEVSLQFDERVEVQQTIVALKAITYTPPAPPHNHSKAATNPPATEPPEDEFWFLESENISESPSGGSFLRGEIS